MLYHNSVVSISLLWNGIIAKQSQLSFCGHLIQIGQINLFDRLPLTVDLIGARVARGES